MTENVPALFSSPCGDDYVRIRTLFTLSFRWEGDIFEDERGEQKWDKAVFSAKSAYVRHNGSCDLVDDHQHALGQVRILMDEAHPDYCRSEFRDLKFNTSVVLNNTKKLISFDLSTWRDCARQ